MRQYRELSWCREDACSPRPAAWRLWWPQHGQAPRRKRAHGLHRSSSPFGRRPSDAVVVGENNAGVINQIGVLPFITGKLQDEERRRWTFSEYCKDRFRPQLTNLPRLSATNTTTCSEISNGIFRSPAQFASSLFHSTFYSPERECGTMDGMEIGGTAVTGRHLHALANNTHIVVREPRHSPRRALARMPTYA